jgi:hypothetical protein
MHGPVAEFPSSASRQICFRGRIALQLLMHTPFAGVSSARSLEKISSSDSLFIISQQASANFLCRTGKRASLVLYDGIALRVFPFECSLPGGGQILGIV